MSDLARTPGGFFPYLHVGISISAVFHISPHYFILKKYYTDSEAEGLP